MTTPAYSQLGFKTRSNRLGFTLIELLIALVIAGILAAVAYPAFTSQVTKSRRSDAIAALTATIQAQERWRANQSSYAASVVDDLKFSSADSPKGHYTLTVAGVGVPASLTSGFSVTASPLSTSPQKDDKDCASFTAQLLLGQLTYSSKDASGADSTAKCWPK